MEFFQAVQDLAGTTKIQVETDAIVHAAAQSNAGHKTVFHLESKLLYFLLQIRCDALVRGNGDGAGLCEWIHLAKIGRGEW